VLRFLTQSVFFSFVASCRDGHLHPSLAIHYSKELVEMLHLLTHPDPQVCYSVVLGSFFVVSGAKVNVVIELIIANIMMLSF